MSRLNEQLEHVLEHRKITDDDVRIIRNQILSDGKLDNEDVKFLVELLSDAQDVCPAFDDLFFPALKQVLLADGKIGQDDHFRHASDDVMVAVQVESAAAVENLDAILHVSGIDSIVSRLRPAWWGRRRA